MGTDEGDRGAHWARLVEAMPHGALVCRLEAAGALRLEAANGAAGRLLGLDLAADPDAALPAVFPLPSTIALLVDTARVHKKVRVELSARPDGRAFSADVFPLGEGVIGILFTEVEGRPSSSRRASGLAFAAAPPHSSPISSSPISPAPTSSRELDTLDEGTAPRTPPRPVPTPAPSNRFAVRGRILVVDDEPLVGRMVERALGRYHHVTALTSGRDVLERIVAGERYDLILCDLMMPELTGMDLHERMLAHAADQAERMVFLTGGAFTTRARAFLEGRPFLEKPFDLHALEALVRERVGG